MRHYRYLGLLASTVCVQAGTLDELHQKIQQRNKRNGFLTTFVEVDTWTEPGELVLDGPRGPLIWRAWGLPRNPPAQLPHFPRRDLEARGVVFNGGLAKDENYWFWSHDGRSWAVGPYTLKSTAQRARERYLELDNGPEMRSGWTV